MNETVERALLDHLKTPIVVVSEDGQITYQNEAFDRTFGSGSGEWLNRAARAVAGERGWLQGFFLESDQIQAVDVDYEGRIYHVDTITSFATERRAVALCFDDVTQQREAEQAKSDFTSMIVHDLRGPLSGIQGTLEFILSQETSKFDPVHEELLREASRESERMMSLINELLDFSKIESGNFTIDPEPVSISNILKRSVVSLQSVAGRDEIFLLSSHPGNLPLINGSVEKLTQAIINLVSNSLKFTPKRGVIALGAQIDREDGSVIVTVTDSGLGIKANDVDQIFEKYKQTKKKSLRGGGGTGLGLYIVKQIVAAHGGSVEVASVEGVGTSMILRFPIARAVA